MWQEACDRKAARWAGKTLNKVGNDHNVEMSNRMRQYIMNAKNADCISIPNFTTKQAEYLCESSLIVDYFSRNKFKSYV